MDLETTLVPLAPRLLRFCLGLSGDHALAEEAAQDALVALVGRWRRHGPPRDAAAFAFTVARRRLRRRQLRARLLAPLELLAERRSPQPDPELRAASSADLQAALEALARLPPRDREAIALVAAGELDTAQAAAVLGISRSALKMRVHRARKRLHHLLENDHDHRPSLNLTARR